MLRLLTRSIRALRPSVLSPQFFRSLPGRRDESEPSADIDLICDEGDEGCARKHPVSKGLGLRAQGIRV